MCNGVRSLGQWKTEKKNHVVWRVTVHPVCTDGKRRVWLELHEVMYPDHFVTTAKVSGGGVMVWVMFCWYGTGLLILMDTGFSSKDYLNIVADGPSSNVDFLSRRWPLFHGRQRYYCPLGVNCSASMTAHPPSSLGTSKPGSELLSVWGMFEKQIQQGSPLPSNLSQSKDCLLNA